MDLFFSIDWTNLKEKVNGLEKSVYDSSEENQKSLRDVLKSLYLIETDLTKVKEKLNLPYLNPTINSSSVVKSFHRKREQDSLFKNERRTFNDFFRQNDYQYWLLIFLFLKNNEIHTEHFTLYQIIDLFVNRIKDQSFNWEDIEFTGSGSTRCKTNLRFAFNDLKDIGLINLYDPNHKNSWTLTFIGFFIAASLVVYPVDTDRKPLSTKITKFHQSTYYFQINKGILKRTLELSDPDYFFSLVKRLNLEDLAKDEINRGWKVFKSYHDNVTQIFESGGNEQQRAKQLATYLKDMNKQFPFNNFLKEIAQNFNVDEWIKGL